MTASEERSDGPAGAEDDGGARPGPSETGSETPFTQQVGRVVVGVLAALFLVFAFFNRQDVTVDWLFTTTETPLIVVLIGTFVLGTLVGVVFLWRRHRVQARPGPGEDQDR